MANNKTGLNYYNVDTDRYMDIRIRRLVQGACCLRLFALRGVPGTRLFCCVGRKYCLQRSRIPRAEGIECFGDCEILRCGGSF